MKIEALSNDRVADYVSYCKKHKKDLDDSFLYDEDLRDFQPDAENPTYIVVDNNDEIIAAVSLIIDDYNRRGKKGRFRIFYSEVDSFECYDMLLKAIVKHTEGLENLYIFAPIVNEKLMKSMESLNFSIDRYSFLLVRDNLAVQALDLPEGYNIRPFIAGKDEETWCFVRNAGFAKLKGSETPATPEMIAKMVSGEDNIEGGMLLLFHKDRPVGVVRGSMDEYEDKPIMNIGPLAIIPEYQGKGLGRTLLRASLKIAQEKGYDRTVLCVNGENERAKALYLQEGFVQTEAVVCYRYALTGGI